MPSAVGFYPPSLGSTLRRWVLLFVVGFYPSSLGSTPRRYTHRCWVEYVVVGLNSLSLGFIRVVSPYSPSLRWIWLSLWWSFGGSPWDGVVVVESLVGAAPLVVVVCVLIQWKSTVLFALLFAALALGTGVVSGMARLRKRENEPRLSSWFVVRTHWMGLPMHGSPLVFPPTQFLHRARTNRPHPFGKGRGG